MAMTKCPKCKKEFDPHNYLVEGGAAAAGAAAGAWIGSGLGIAGGPLGAIAGTIPGAIVGAAVVGLGARQVARCPGCGKTFLV